MLYKIITTYIVNIVALFAAVYFVTGFEITPTAKGYLIVGALLTAVNLVIRPVIKFILTPVIILTLGLFSLVINSAILYILDIMSTSLTIRGFLPLLYATLIITAINIILRGTTKK
ncbi:MAG: hypothetical protein COU07_03965 [Candidatus Harrisonbacteria bacterium CG10_big_fil_rev_8_21_14_0_10_40_38]|uniref:Phage holin family protein n=1 Tax=Candidatus Harrisonbacteria bacterium CG10_big_fil_rev_8_21_14_0_10_40_38 TaxID=1974583 RepID=A0A2H0URJ8_9BACT|nr:MAG: hypothetical protein COU07_03965 [Candidatus Harrisonbacteria bacterium CG10_big_fil_rev_8_21_14_0_10_40_38]